MSFFKCTYLQHREVHKCTSSSSGHFLFISSNTSLNQFLSESSSGLFLNRILWPTLLNCVSCWSILFVRSLFSDSDMVNKFSTGNGLTEISLSLLTEEYPWSKKISFRVSEISTGHAGLARISINLSLLTEYPWSYKVSDFPEYSEVLVALFLSDMSLKLNLTFDFFVFLVLGSH